LPDHPAESPRSGASQPLSRTLEAELAELRREIDRARRDAELCRTILESITDYAVFTVDPDARVTSWNAGASNLLGWSEGEALGMDSRAVFTPEDRARGAPDAEIAKATAEGRAENERWHVRKDGSRFWGSGLLLPLRGGLSPGYLKIMRDRTEQQEAMQRQGILLRELEHRVKNTLAMIQSMARQTSTRTTDLAAFLPTFAGRLHALAAAHDLLTASGWQGTSLAALVRTALAPHDDHGGPRIRAALDDLPVGPAVAQNLVLALHELATNAARHGALSGPDGSVAIEGRAEGDKLVLVWRESGGPPAAPPGRRGFGTTLLEHLIAYQHGGQVDLDWRPEGLACTLRLPLRA
jgi:PAS domain S-box-containing protein